MKTKEELAALKEEYDALKAKFSDLTDEELSQVAGGVSNPPKPADLLGAEVFLSFDLNQDIEIPFKQRPES